MNPKINCMVAPRPENYGLAVEKSVDKCPISVDIFGLTVDNYV